MRKRLRGASARWTRSPLGDPLGGGQRPARLPPQGGLDQPPSTNDRTPVRVTTAIRRLIRVARDDLQRKRFAFWSSFVLCHEPNLARLNVYRLKPPFVASYTEWRPSAKVTATSSPSTCALVGVPDEIRIHCTKRPVRAS